MRLYRNSLLLLTGLVFYAGFSFAQPVTIIEGYVINQETGDPVSYATISLPEQNQGISANLNGYFYLQVGTINPEDHLQVTSIGYQKYSVAMEQLNLQEQLIIKLKPQTTLLEEVVVTGEAMKAMELIRMSSKNLKKHLGAKPYLLSGLYREILKINQKYVGFTEGTAMFYLDGYHKDHNTSGRESYTYDLAQWKQMRRSDYNAPDTTLLPPYLIIPKLFKAKDYYLYDGPLQRDHFSDISYKVDSLTLYEDQLVYIVSFKSNKDRDIKYKGKLFLKEDDFGLMAMEVTGTPDKKLYHTSRKKQAYDISHTFKVNYTLFEGRYYISYLGLDYAYTIDLDNKPYQVMASTEVVGGQFSDQKAEVLNHGQINVLYGEMLNPVINYDEDFWNSFPYAYSPGEAVFKDLGNVNYQFQMHDQQRLVPLPDEFEDYQELYNDRALFDVFFQDF